MKEESCKEIRKWRRKKFDLCGEEEESVEHWIERCRILKRTARNHAADCLRAVFIESYTKVLFTTNCWKMEVVKELLFPESSNRSWVFYLRSLFLFAATGHICIYLAIWISRTIFTGHYNEISESISLYSFFLKMMALWLPWSLTDMVTWSRTSMVPARWHHIQMVQSEMFKWKLT